MQIQILNTAEKIPMYFINWASVDLACPRCQRIGLVIKYRYNGSMGKFLSSSGIVLSCDKPDCKDYGIQNTKKGYGWYTWLSSFHREIDLARGGLGKSFMETVRVEYPPIYAKLLMLNYQIDIMFKGNQKPNEEKEITTDFKKINNTLENY